MRKLLTILALLIWTISVQSQVVIKASPNYKPVPVAGGCGADLDVIYSNGGNYTQAGTVWKSTDGVSHWCVFGAGYLPFGLNAYYYADVRTTDDSTSGVVLALKQTTDFANCTELDGWGNGIRYAIEPVWGGANYRAYNGVTDTHHDTGVAYQNGDKFGLFVSDAGVVTAQYYRSGVWTVMWTFANNATGNLYLGGNGFEISHIVNPKVSCNYGAL